MHNPFLNPGPRVKTQNRVYSEHERGLANRNHGAILETLALDITPTGAHYLLTHFDVPILDAQQHRLSFKGAFSNPFELSMRDPGKPVNVTHRQLKRDRKSALKT